MDENLNNRQKELLHNLLANPADTGSAYATDLQEMVNAYPQSGLLRVLYGRALNEKKPVIAGAYFDGTALHKLFFHNDNLLPVNQEQIVLQAGSVKTDTSAAPPVQQQTPTAYTPTEPVFYQKDDSSDILTDQPPGFPDVLNVSWLTNPEEEFAANIPAETDQDNDTSVEPVEQIQEPIAEEHTTAEPETPVIPEEDEEFIWPPAVSDEPVEPQEALIEQPEEPQPQPIIAPETPPLALPADVEQESPIEDEVFEEITGIDDIEIVQNPADVSTAPVAAEEAVTETAQPVTDSQEIDPATADEAEKLMLGNIAATDYFVFDRAFGDKKPADEAAEPAQTPVIAQPAEPFVEENTPHQDVSKYHDEKMPYTFMWWLDKTRKEHGGLYQPYSKAPVASPVRKPVPNELQQQYLENIFHISSIEDLNNDAAKTVEFDMQSREDRIIQRFITQDPHIHPPVGEKLDTENKAKKSSEDSYEMVTETLAQIYADQMLYPKAIATYQKLMLKYPEKSRYFASRIENLEKKTN